MHRSKYFCLLGLLTFASFAAAQDSHAFLWTKATHMQDLGTLGGSQSFAYGINSSGEVVGCSDVAGDLQRHAFKWTQAGGMQDLGTLTGYDSGCALGINNSNQVVGYVYNSSNSQITHAALWSADGRIQDLGTLGGSSSAANAINNSGNVTGYSQTSGGSTLYAFLWTPANGMRRIGTQTSDGIGIGQSSVVGYNNGHASMWTAGTMFQDLGTLGGDTSSANGISSTGKVVGSSEITRGGGDVHAFVWDTATGMSDLGTLTGGNYSDAFAINSQGVIAGQSNIANGDLHAVLWTASGKIIDIGTLGGVTAYATALNGNGQVAGYSLLP